MKRSGYALCIACALIAVVAGNAGIASANPHGSLPAIVDASYFYDALEPYGFWVTIDPYGFVWVPTDVSADWQPYTNGYWTRTDYGWTWIDYAEWGWAPFHYGRWAHDWRYGWVWVPDTVWGPAWVAWRLGDGFVGWAPLPPEAHWRIGIGFVADGWRFGVGIGPGAWCFVPDRHFLHHHVRRHFVPRHRADHCLRITRDVTDYGYDHDRVVDRGISVRDIERRIGQPVKQHVIIDRAPQERPGRTIRRGNEVRVHRPLFRLTEEARVMRPPVDDRVGKPERQITEAQQPRARAEQDRPKLERRDRESDKRTDARRDAKDDVQLQNEQKQAPDRQQKEPRKAEPRRPRETQQERTRRR